MSDDKYNPFYGKRCRVAAVIGKATLTYLGVVNDVDTTTLSVQDRYDGLIYLAKSAIIQIVPCPLNRGDF